MAILLLIAWTWIALPIIPLTWAWTRSLRGRPAKGARATLGIILLVVTTASYLLIWLGIVQIEVLGHYYTPGRFTMIYVNLALMCVLAVSGAASDPRLRIPVISSCILTGSVWLYVAVVSSMIL